MRLLAHMASQDVQERNKQVKDQETAVEIGVQFTDRKEIGKHFRKGKMPVTRNFNQDNRQDHVKHDLAEQFQELPQGDVPGTHEIPGNQHKAVYADFSPGAEKQDELAVERHRIQPDRFQSAQA